MSITTSITQAEMMLGAALLPMGKRQTDLRVTIEAIFTQDLHGHVLAFDSVVVSDYVEIVTSRQKIGRPISQFDAQIAAIATNYQATLATRNIKDFEECGLDLVSPWGIK